MGKYFKLYVDINYSNVYQTDNNHYLHPVWMELTNLNQKEISIIVFYLFDVFGQWDGESKKCNIPLYKDEFRNSLFEIEKWIICMLQTYGTGQSLKETYSNLIRFLLAKLKYMATNEEKLIIIPELINKWVNNDLPDRHDQELGFLISDKYKMPSLKEIQQQIINSPIKQVQIMNAFLMRLEEYLFNKNDMSKRHIHYDTKKSLEHIMPQTLNDVWRDELKTPERPSKADVEMQHNQYIDYLGNMLLLSQNTNSSLKNKSFASKKQVYLDEHNVFATDKFVVDFKQNKETSIAESPKWSFKLIEKRTERLAEILLQGVYKIK